MVAVANPDKTLEIASILAEKYDAEIVSFIVNDKNVVLFNILSYFFVFLP